MGVAKTEGDGTHRWTRHFVYPHFSRCMDCQASLLTFHYTILFFNFIVQPLIYMLIVLIPISIGFAVLRYRLYDIDLLINRSLVYGTLTLSLAFVYAGLIIGLQALLRARLQLSAKRCATK